MKLLKVFFLIFLYLAAGVDWNIQLHFCGGNLASISVVEGSASCSCSEDDLMPCCDDEQVRISASTDDQQVQSTSLNVLGAPFVTLAYLFPQYVETQVALSGDNESYHDSSPPVEKQLENLSAVMTQKLILYA